MMKISLIGLVLLMGFIADVSAKPRGKAGNHRQDMSVEYIPSYTPLLYGKTGTSR